jgi:tetratricopeptide (TPR) repeat protein
VWDTRTGKLLASEISDIGSVPGELTKLVQLASRYLSEGNGLLTRISGPQCLFLQKDLLSDDRTLADRFCRWCLAEPYQTPIFMDAKSSSAEWIHGAIGGRDRLSALWIADANAVLPEDCLVELALAGVNKPNPMRADFFRQTSVKHLPDNSSLCGTAARRLLDENDPVKALVAAEKCLKINAENSDGLRAKARALRALKRNLNALDAYRLLLETPAVTLDDFSSAIYLSANVQEANVCKELLSHGLKRFAAPSQQATLYEIYGWSLLDLSRPADARTAFQRAQQLLPSGTPPSSNLLAGEVASAWASGQKEQAIKIQQTLIAANENWGDSDFIRNLQWTENETHPLLEALAETLRQHPELKNTSRKTEN